jgi:hypothetical protein
MWTWAAPLLLLPLAAEPSALEADPKGWVDILPGPRLEGWTRVPVKSVLNASTEVWKADRKGGVLRCFGHLPAGGDKPGSHEFLRYDRELGDFVFHVEWRFVDDQSAGAGKEPRTEPRKGKSKGWNSGVYARNNADATVWHQAQTGDASGGFWFGDSPDETGKVVRRKLDAREARVRPAGEWNTFEITARGDTLTLWVNGAVTSVWTGLRVPRGFIGLEAEYHPVEFRRLRLKVLK